MEKELDELIAKYEEGNMSLITLKAELLRLFSVSVQCEHPYDSILKGNDIRPTQCLKCGKALSEH